MIKRLLFIVSFFALSAPGFAQHSDESGNIKALQMYEDSLTSLGKKIVNNDIDEERKNANYLFIKTLVSALKVPNSFLYPFDSLKAISILNSPDNRFRLLTWHVVNDDGSYRFYGAIQMNTGGTLKLFPLSDYSPMVKNPEDTVMDNNKWFGAQYYKIIRVGGEKQYYVLLGWKGFTDKSTKKVIEVLSFDKTDKPVFGMSVFNNNRMHKRIIFQYTRQASMLLKYVPDEHLIVFDHLSPPDKKSKSIMDTYGPDLSYDGYRLKEGRWEYVDNMDMRNVPEDKDNSFTDPKTQAIIDRSNDH